MNSILDEKTTSEEDGEKEKKLKIKLVKNENDIKNRLRKNPQKTQLLYFNPEREKSQNSKTSELNNSDFQNIKSILEKIKNHPKSFYFRQSPFRMLFTKQEKDFYKSQIHHPQDLSKITKKANHKKYNSYQEFYDDLNLIWDNAQFFNEDTSIIYKDADYMRKNVDILFKEKNIYDKVEHIEKNEDEVLKIDNTNQNKALLIGKKRKIIEDEEVSEEINKGLKEPIINIQNNTEYKDEIKDEKKEANNKDDKQKNEISYHSKQNIENSVTNQSNECNLDHNLKDTNSVSDLSNNSIIQNNLIRYNGNIAFYDKNEYNSNNKKMKMTNEKLNINESYKENIIQKNNNYISDNNIKSDISKIDINNILLQYRYDENLQKKEEMERKEKAKNDISYNYAYKIGKELDKLNDEDMFDLIEYIDSIRPEAIFEIDNDVKIDMTKFIPDTFIHVSNFIKHIKINKSLK